MRFLVCPNCRAELDLIEVEREEGNQILEGALGCSHKDCGKQFPILGGIPRFVAKENYASGFGLQWINHARTQYDSTSGVNVSETRFFEETQWPRKMDGEIIIEVGSGSGRFTEQAAATGATVLSLDYSFAVEANYRSNGARENVLIVQGDIYQMPFHHDSADRVFCFGVLQHTPHPKKSFLELPKFAKPGGSVVADNYVKITGIRSLFATKYWFRPFTKHIPPLLLYKLCNLYVRAMWPLSRIIHHLPKGKYINWRLFLSDHRGEYALSEKMMCEWAVLDMVDKLGPAYDFPQTLETIEEWFKAAGLEDVDVRPGYNGIQGRGRKPS
ncbi:MAG: methyltransferase domain-containing protein [Verrucomicrobiales bacterium]|nr:methyltransferase domain-containing protein [Verrucomicrobiales bacterium]